MVQNLTDKEFQNYIKTLKFDNMFDLAHFIRAYFEHYVDRLVNGTEDGANRAYANYAILMSFFGMNFVTYMETLEAKNKMNEDVDYKPQLNGY